MTYHSLIPRPSPPPVFDSLKCEIWFEKYCCVQWHHVDRGRHTGCGAQRRISKLILVMSIQGLEARAFSQGSISTACEQCQRWVNVRWELYGWTLPSWCLQGLPSPYLAAANNPGLEAGTGVNALASSPWMDITGMGFEIHWAMCA